MAPTLREARASAAPLAPRFLGHPQMAPGKEDVKADF